MKYINKIKNNTLILYIIGLVISTNSLNATGNMKDFNSQEELNHVVGNKAVQLYQDLNEHSRYPSLTNKEDLSIAEGCWKIDYSHGVGVIVKKNNSKISPSQGLEKAFKEKNVLECFTARTLVTAQCIHILLGSEKFDSLYQEYETRLKKQKQPVFLHNFCGNFLDPLDENQSIRTYKKPGGIVSIINFPAYKSLYPKGLFTNDNLFTCLDEETNSIKYIGFGKNYKEGPLLYEGTLRCMREHNNKVFEYEHSAAYKIVELHEPKLLGFANNYSNGKINYAEVYNFAEKLGKTKFIHKDYKFQDKLLDFIQTAPVAWVSYQWIQFAKKAKTKSDMDSLFGTLQLYEK